MLARDLFAPARAVETTLRVEAASLNPNRPLLIEGKFLHHPCLVCGAYGPFGFARAGDEFGRWACADHRDVVERMA